MRNQDRREEIATYISNLLQRLNCQRSAQKLRQEANLDRVRNVEVQVDRIMAKQELSPSQKQQAIDKYFLKYLSGLIKNDRIEEALTIYQQCLPLYYTDVQKFSYLFAENITDESNQVEAVLEAFILDHSMLPQKKLWSTNFKNEVWFLKTLGDSILVIDNYSNSWLVRDSKILIQKQGLHEGQINCVTVRDKDIWATGGDDKFCRIWNKKMQKLYELMHGQRVMSLAFSILELISGSFDQTLSVTCFSPEAFASLTGVKLHTRLFKYKNVIHLIYMDSKKVVIALANAKEKGQISFLDLDKPKVLKTIKCQRKVYSIELSICQKLLFANSSSAEILVFGTRKLDLRYKFTGYVQNQFLMRMAIGSSNGNLLAVTSEDGFVCIYDLKRQRLIERVKVGSGCPVNCVAWIRDELFVGCDDGQLEQWVT